MRKQIYVFGTIISIEFTCENESSIMDEIIDKMNKLDDEMSIYKDYSIVSNINKMAGKEYVKVSDDVMYIIKKSIEYSDITDGELDITSKPVIDIIKSGKFNICDIQEKRKLINYKNILINEKDSTIKLKYEGMGIDLGSMVKGYATDIVVGILNKYNVSNALIDLGGNIYVKGLNKDNNKWNVGVQDPFNLRYNTVGTLKLTNKSIVTSGNYERANHIISPKTGLPINDELASVTIISDRSIEGEGLSTACYVMGLKKSIELLQSLKDIDGILITNKKEVYCISKTVSKYTLLNDEYSIINILEEDK